LLDVLPLFLVAGAAALVYLGRRSSSPPLELAALPVASPPAAPILELAPVAARTSPAPARAPLTRAQINALILRRQAAEQAAHDDGLTEAARGRGADVPGPNPTGTATTENLGEFLAALAFGASMLAGPGTAVFGVFASMALTTARGVPMTSLSFARNLAPVVQDMLTDEIDEEAAARRDGFGMLARDEDENALEDEDAAERAAAARELAVAAGMAPGAAPVASSGAAGDPMSEPVGGMAGGEGPSGPDAGGDGGGGDGGGAP
jgi:hypothetical protein